MSVGFRSYLEGNTFLILILFLAFLLRVSAIETVPPSLNWDEISHGYNAYSILKTAKDQWGQVLPLINFRAYGDYPLPLNLYLTIPSIFIFGLSEFSIRLPHVIFGILTALASYYLALGLSKNKKLSLLVSFLIAIEPWTFFTSRIVLQQNLSVLLLTASTALFVNRGRNKNYILLSLFFLFLTLFSYHSTRIFSPLFLAGSLVIFRNELVLLYKKIDNTKKVFFLAIPLFLVISFAILMEPNARARSQWLFIINQASINKIVEARQNSNLPPYISRLVYNRPTYFIAQFSKNYFEYLSPKFLFFKGGTQFQYSLPNWGLSYIVNLPFFYLGLLLLMHRAFRGVKNYQLILLWLVLSPIAGSITSEHYAVTRASLMIPLPELLSGIGLFSLISYLGKRLGQLQFVVLSLYTVFLLIFAYKYYIDYFGNYSNKYSEAWQHGYKEVVDYLKNNYDKYDKIIITKKYGEPHEFVLFYWPWDPQKYLDDKSKISFYQSGWWWVDRFDKLYFVNDWQVVGSNPNEFNLESKGNVDCKNVLCLLVTGPGNAPKDWRKLETINFLNQGVAFEIYDNK